MRVPNGLAFSEKLPAVILANPVIINAYQSGIPGNGKPIPDGAKMARIHGIPKKHETFSTTTVPASLHDVDFVSALHAATELKRRLH